MNNCFVCNNYIEKDEAVVRYFFIEYDKTFIICCKCYNSKSPTEKRKLNKHLANIVTRKEKLEKLLK